MYSRHFITLKENNQSATLEKRTAFGRCILETNNQNLKVSLSIQYLRSDYIYKVFIIYKKDFFDIKSLCMGSINVDIKGKGEFKKEFEDYNFLEKELPDDFDAIFVVAIKNHVKNVVLEGYKNEKFAWDKSFLNNILEKKTDENMVIDDLKENALVKEEVTLETEKTKELKESLIQENTQDEEDKDPKKDPKQNLINCNPPMIPFQRQNRNVEWVRINLEEINYLPVDYFEYVSSPFILNAYKNYNHLIFGYVNDDLGENYYLGIPEMYDSLFEKIAEDYGFMQFKCCDDIKPKDGEYGYWLVKIL